MSVPPDFWTVADVERWLLIAYRSDSRSPGVAGAMSWPALFILEFDERQAVHLWAWAIGREGISISELLCNRPSLGSRDTFDRRRQRGIAAIVAGLNRDESRRQNKP